MGAKRIKCACARRLCTAIVMVALALIGTAAECRVAATGTPLHILALIRDTSGEAGVPGPAHELPPGPRSGDADPADGWACPCADCARKRLDTSGTTLLGFEHYVGRLPWDYSSGPSGGGQASNGQTAPDLGTPRQTAQADDTMQDVDLLPMTVQPSSGAQSALDGIKRSALDDPDCDPWEADGSNDADMEPFEEPPEGGGSQAEAELSGCTPTEDKGVPISLFRGLDGPGGDTSVHYTDFSEAHARLQRSWQEWSHALKRRGRSAAEGKGSSPRSSEQAVAECERLSVAARDAACTLAKAQSAWQRQVKSAATRNKGQATETDANKETAEATAQASDAAAFPVLSAKLADIQDHIKVCFGTGGRAISTEDAEELTAKCQAAAEALNQERDRYGGGDPPPVVKAAKRKPRGSPADEKEPAAHNGASVGLFCPHDREGAERALTTHRPWRNRRRGARKPKRKGQLSIFYGNPNELSTLRKDDDLDLDTKPLSPAEAYILSQSVDVVCVGESHIRGTAALGKAEKAFARAGWVANIAEAAQSASSEAGNCGGAICAVRSHLARKPLLADLDAEHNVTQRSATLDLAGWGLGVQSADILVYAGYCRHGEVAEHVARISADTNKGARPFVWLADFNTKPEELQAQGWLSSLKAVVVRPVGADVSCTQQSGSVIDLIVCSECLAPYITECSYITEVPWSPHYGILLRIACDPAHSMKRVMVRHSQRFTNDNLASGEPPSIGKPPKVRPTRLSSARASWSRLATSSALRKRSAVTARR